ncbi:alkaline-phosphatase-like protein [Phascolomyces articulosus]|uniref:Alkaline phosphatase n=1 Tax=Phascolomyces articulosus TaxID=60185 RepID=A0AAD5JKV0_9FUNG|nr:alkaline-phosphatase-like protein [Phascolomyces articulosus]
MMIGAWVTPPILSSNQQASSTSETGMNKPRNVIMMISDGLGPASVSYARSYFQHLHQLPYDHQLPLDTIHVGQSRTRSSSTLVTDSAAGATAFSCGLKTYNGAVGVDPKGNPCGTVLEAAKLQHHMRTGLVATSRITHATPASFSAHIRDRDRENHIAVQQIGNNPLGRTVDLMFGGGYCHFLPKGTHGSCRKDDRDLFKEAQEKHGWQTVFYNNRTAFDNETIELPAIALFADDHMDYEIDRDPAKQPSLTEMADKALTLLSGSEEGFFLMIEGSRIDMAAHSNDPAGHLHDILEYQNTISLVKDFVDQNPDTIMISTSDHETGGLSLARQVTPAYPKYLWYPDVVANASHSTVFLANMLHKQPKPLDDQYIIETILQQGLGITDATKKELRYLKSTTSEKNLDKYLADMLSIRAQLGWATHGHSGVDVNLYAYGVNADELRGSHENIFIGDFISRMLDLNLNETTQSLNHNNNDFHVIPLTDDDKIEYTNHLDKYHSNPRNLRHLTFD